MKEMKISAILRMCMWPNNNKLQGIQEDGQEIAVTRHSTYSTHGVEEFKYEVSCTAKLQGRNLIRLLGWSITEEGGWMLVYKYKPEKSLDFFIFGGIYSMFIIHFYQYKECLYQITLV